MRPAPHPTSATGPAAPTSAGNAPTVARSRGVSASVPGRRVAYASATVS